MPGITIHELPSSEHFIECGEWVKRPPKPTNTETDTKPGMQLMYTYLTNYPYLICSFLSQECFQVQQNSANTTTNGP